MGGQVIIAARNIDLVGNRYSTGRCLETLYATRRSNVDFGSDYQWSRSDSSCRGDSGGRPSSVAGHGGGIHLVDSPIALTDVEVGAVENRHGQIVGATRSEACDRRVSTEHLVVLVDIALISRNIQVGSVYNRAFDGFFRSRQGDVVPTCNRGSANLPCYNLGGGAKCGRIYRCVYVPAVYDRRVNLGTAAHSGRYESIGREIIVCRDSSRSDVERFYT